jgi:small subunit ribosomal protein S8
MGTGVINDPIGDMLTRIRNGLIARKGDVSIPHSRLKVRIAEILVNEGYISDVDIIAAGINSEIKVKLKYTQDRQPVIHGLKRRSRPGLRVYADRNSMPRVQGGLGVAIVSTSKGIMTDRDARKSRVGGELLCEVW